MDIYEELGVSKLINAAGTYTVVGGSRMSEITLKAMQEAANSHVSIRELQRRVGARIAELTHNEAAYITCGAAAGLYLAAAACVAAKLGQAAATLTFQETSGCEVVVFKTHRNPYDWSLRQLGVRITEVQCSGDGSAASKADLANAITDHTIAVFYTLSGWLEEGALGLQDTVAVAESRGVPVIVDAAAQVPPVDNLWNFTKAGVTAAIFSGGKDLRGPQASGLMVGKQWLVDILLEEAFPNSGIGRMLKVGREEIAGLFAAVKQYVNMDHVARAQWCGEQIRLLKAAFVGESGVIVERSFPNEAGQPLPRAIVRFADSQRNASEIANDLLNGSPAVYVKLAGKDGIYVNPMTLAEGELAIVIERLRQVLKDS
ncbi:MAG: hypothetical protein GX977_04800 [Firmicutes bacterium]|nr:hypothetical protein [Bacillota bacterium]